MIVELFKRNTKNNKIQYWSIEISDGKYRTSEGYYDGKITTNEWVQCYPKNIGKSNETTANEQATIEAVSKIAKKEEKGYCNNIANIDESLLIFEPMLAHKFENGTKINEPVISQPKLDGIRNIATSFGCFTRQWKQQYSIPHIEESLTDFFQSYPNVMIDGELYNHDLRDNFNTITSIARKQKPTQDDLLESKKFIQFHVYDIFFEKEPNKPIEERLEFIKNAFVDNPFIKIVETTTVKNQEELDILYLQYMQDGYEGQMIRKENSKYEQKRSKNLLKRKEFIDDEFEIVDINEGVGNWSGKAKTILFKNKNGEQFSTGVKGTMEYCKELLDNKKEHIGKMATVRYQQLSEYGIPRFGVMYCIRDYE